MDKTNSVSLDIGKGLCLPVGVVAAMVREHWFLYDAMTRHRSGEYLPIDVRPSEPVYEPKSYSWELARPCRALPVWFTAYILGTKACG